MMARALLVLSIAAGCTEVERPTRPETNFDLLRPFDSSPRVMSLPYATPILGLVDSCCPRAEWDGPPPENVAVCRALQNAVERGAPHASAGWGPHCYDAISTESLIKAVARTPRDSEWSYAVRRLSEREPSQAARAVLFRALIDSELPSESSDLSAIGARSWYPTTALALGGEDDLRPLVPSLASLDPTERLWATHVFFYATSLPLDLPEVLPLLDRLEFDPDPRVVERARAASLQYKSWADADLDSWAALASDVFVPSADGTYPQLHEGLAAMRLQDFQHKTFTIRLLGRRHAFCRSRVATVVLETLARDGDVSVADMAKRAVLLRRRRCGKTLVGS